LDNKTSSYKRIKDEKDLDQVLKRFHERWDNRGKPELRHNIRVRELIRKNGGLVKHDDMVEILMKEYGYCERIINEMLDFFIENKVINNKYFDDKMDLRYFMYE